MAVRNFLTAGLAVARNEKRDFNLSEGISEAPRPDLALLPLSRQHPAILFMTNARLHWRQIHPAFLRVLAFMR